MDDKSLTGTKQNTCKIGVSISIFYLVTHVFFFFYFVLQGKKILMKLQNCLFLKLKNTYKLGVIYDISYQISRSKCVSTFTSLTFAHYRTECVYSNFFILNLNVLAFTFVTFTIEMFYPNMQSYLCIFFNFDWIFNQSKCCVVLCEYVPTLNV